MATRRYDACANGVARLCISVIPPISMVVAPIIGTHANAERADLHTDATRISTQINLCTSWRCSKKHYCSGSNSKPMFSHLDLLFIEERQ